MKYTNAISEDIKQAMREKQKEKLEALRAVKTAFTLAKTSRSGGEELSDEEEMSIMQKLVKQRKESATIYNEQNRPELAEKELMEAEFIEKYLPESMTEDEIREVVSQIVSETGAPIVQ